MPALFGLTTQLVCLYLILPKETDNSKLQHSISCVIGGLVAGLSAIFWRFISNKTQLFYRSQDTLTETRHATVSMSRKISDFFSRCVCSSIVENEVDEENLGGMVTPRI